MSRETYYTVLGIAESASQSDIKSAYRSLLKKIHPDTVSTLSEETRRHAEDATRDINEAYSVLSDAGQRAEYDFFLAEQRKAAVTVSASQSTQSATLSPSTSNSVMTYEGDVALQERRRRRRRRRRSHDRRHSSRHGYVKSLFRPVSVADWLVLFGYVFLAVAVLVILFFLVSSVPSLQEESKRVGTLQGAQIAVVWINGAGDRDRTGDIQLGKLAFYR